MTPNERWSRLLRSQVRRFKTRKRLSEAAVQVRPIVSVADWPDTAATGKVGEDSNSHPGFRLGRSYSFDEARDVIT